MQTSDQEIQRQVEEVLKNTTRVDEKELQVSVKDSVVHLTGCVDSAYEKRIARTLAEDVQGVQYVHDDVHVKNFVKRPDNELAEEVRHALLRDAFVEGAQIEVRANNGEIELDGNVPTYSVKKAAQDVAWWTPGVINVENLLLVTDEEFVDVSPLEVTNSG